MNIFAIFRTPKDTDDATFVGQTGDPSFAATKEVSKKVTGQKANSATRLKNDDGSLALETTNTDDYHVDIVPKRILGQVKKK